MVRSSTIVFKIKKASPNRAAWLAGTALATGVLAGVAFAPYSALAACTLIPGTPDSVDCPAGPQTGGSFVNNANTNLVVAPGSVVTNVANTPAVSIDASGGANNINAYVLSSVFEGPATVTGTGANGHGIQLLSGGGNINVQTDVGTHVTGSTDGFRIRTNGSGNITLLMSGSATSTATGEAIDAQTSGTGTVTADLIDGAYTSAASDVIVLGSAGGPVNVTVASPVSITGGNDLGDHGLFITQASSATVDFNGNISVAGDAINIGTVGAGVGNVSVTTAATSTLTGGNNGIAIGALGLEAGNVDVENNAHINAGGGSGILISANGNVFVANTNANTIQAGNDGIQIVSGGNVDVRNVGSIGNATTSVGGDGISINAVGNVTVSDTYLAATGGSIFATGNGVNATGASVDVDMRNSTIITGGAGILAASTFGGVTVHSGNVTSGTSGVVAMAAGGDAAVTTHGKISSGGLFGAAAFSDTGNATVTVNAMIDPPLVGAATATFGPGAATTNVNATVQAIGLGAGAGNFFGSGNATVNINAGGAIESDGIGVATANIFSTGSGAVFLDGAVGGLTAAATGGDGVLMVGFAHDGSLTFNSTGNGTINAGGDGVSVFKLFGNGSINVTTGAGITAGDDGVQVIQAFGTSDIGITTNAGIVAGDDGIFVDKNFASGNITILTNSTVSGGDEAIHVTQTNSFNPVNISVTSIAALTATDNGIEIFKSDSDGNINVDTSGGGTINAGADGINIVRLFGNGSIAVNAAPIVAGDDGIVVVQAFGTSDISVTASTINGGNATTAVGDDGIFVDKNFASGNVTVNANGGINATDDGIHVNQNFSFNSVNIAVNTNAGIIAGDDGVNINKTNSAGNISVAVNGNIDAGDEGLQIYRSLSGPAGSNILVEVGANALSAINAGQTGIQIDAPFALNDVAVNVYGGSSVVAGDSAISVNTFSVFGDNTVNIYNNGYLEGSGGLFSPTVGVFSDGPVTITNDFDGTITNRTGDFGLAVAATSINGPVHLQNNGHLEGAVVLTSFGDTATFNNTSFNTWETSGFSFITAANDATVNNTGAVVTGGDAPFTFITLTSFDANTAVNNNAYWENNGLTVIAQGSFNGGTNTVYNSGTFQNAGVTAFTSFAGQPLEFYNDGGYVSMINGNANQALFGPLQSQGYDTWVGDITAIDGNYNASGYAGLGVDAILSAPGPASAADRLIITGGVFGGPTGIVVNSDPSLAGAYNPVGVPLVSVTSGITAPSDFYIDPASNNYATRTINGATTGVIDKGLFFYALQQRDVSTGAGYFHDGDDHVLVGLPDRELFELNKAATGAQNIWHETTGVWLDRQADLRTFLDNPACVAGAGADLSVYKSAPPICTVQPPTPGIWMKAVGAWTDRKNANDSYRFSPGNSVNALSVAYNTDYKQNTFGVMGGIDFGKGGVVRPDDTLLVGVMGGYLTSSLDFKGSANGFDYSGPTVGGYATYLNGGFFLDAIVKADLLKMKWNATSLAGFYGYSGQEVDATSIGVSVDTGYKFRFAGNGFFEPLATFSWVRTTIDSMNLLGNTFNIADSDSVRGSVGARLGWAGMTGATKVEASVTGRVWHEFEDPGATSVVSYGWLVPGTFQDNMNGTFGDVNGTLNLASLQSGWSGFVNGGVKFNSDFTTLSAKGGVRYNW